MQSKLRNTGSAQTVASARISLLETLSKVTQSTVACLVQSADRPSQLQHFGSNNATIGCLIATVHFLVGLDSVHQWLSICSVWLIVVEFLLIAYFFYWHYLFLLFFTMSAWLQQGMFDWVYWSTQKPVGFRVPSEIKPGVHWLSQKPKAVVGCCVIPKPAG